MRRHKYGAKWTTIDGIKFQSKLEATRYQHLRQWERLRVIGALTLQPRFKLHAQNGDHIATYIADFKYTYNDTLIIEDVKGVLTPIFKLKAKWFASDYPYLHLTIVTKKNIRDLPKKI